ncbi:MULTISPECIES: hypothetical protein [Stenotrophomonas]|jgi:hypothetical protein|uniref:Lipoprotein n=1 Tax=Stenotrophomonas maltophilia TaxID=40324 RepID=A0A4S2D1R7_STEMA|nr:MULTISPECIES: hypothetical protein [Stenotrophomonas]TGY34443.1 hypothetical protein E5352_08310 [Stenotrophomonas maltophilia]
MSLRTLLLLPTLLLLGACNRPAPAPPDTPPEPQATQMRDAIQRPLDRAKAARDMLEKAPDLDAAERAATDTPATPAPPVSR